MTPAMPSQPQPSDTAGSVPRGADRRRSATPRLSRYTFGGGRRRTVRRAGEREGSFVDLYSPLVLLPVLWVAGMNAADSFFTIHHLQAGGIELNPVAALLLESGRFGFVFGKATMISLALLVLCVHQNFFLARIGLGTAVATYTTLVAYHLWLL
jgi:hypothetical protein